MRKQGPTSKFRRPKQFFHLVPFSLLSFLTSWNAVDVVLNEKVDHGNQGTKESVRKQPAVLLCLGVLGCALDGHDDVGDGADEVNSHGNVVDVMVVRGGNIDPATASHGPDYVVGEEELCEAL